MDLGVGDMAEIFYQGICSIIYLDHMRKSPSGDCNAKFLPGDTFLLSHSTVNTIISSNLIWTRGHFNYDNNDDSCFLHFFLALIVNQLIAVSTWILNSDEYSYIEWCVFVLVLSCCWITAGRCSGGPQCAQPLNSLITVIKR